MPLRRDAAPGISDHAYHAAAKRLARAGVTWGTVGGARSLLSFDAEHATSFQRTAPGASQGAFVSCWIWVPADDVTEEDRRVE